MDEKRKRSNMGKPWQIFLNLKFLQMSKKIKFNSICLFSVNGRNWFSLIETEINSWKIELLFCSYGGTGGSEIPAKFPILGDS